MAGSTPIYGFPYPQSTDLVADYPTLGQELATDVETVISGLGSGLNIITPTSIANSGGSASATGGQVTFTGVNSISLNGVFTSAYANYRVIVKYSAASAGDAYIKIRLRAAGADNTTANSYGAISLFSNASSAGGSGGLNDGWTTGVVNSTYAAYTTFVHDFFSPNQTVISLVNSHAVYTLAAGNRYMELVDGYQSATTAFDGFSIIPTTGTITGVARVYSYKNS